MDETKEPLDHQRRTVRTGMIVLGGLALTAGGVAIAYGGDFLDELRGDQPQAAASASTDGSPSSSTPASPDASATPGTSPSSASATPTPTLSPSASPVPSSPDRGTDGGSDGASVHQDGQHRADGPADAGTGPEGYVPRHAAGEQSQVGLRPIIWGDTLSEIAVETGHSVSELAQINGIANPDLIYAGDILVIPES